PRPVPCTTLFRSSRAGGHLQVVAELADPSFRRSEADTHLHDAGEEGVVLRLSRPGAFVEPADHHGVDALQARFERAEDEDARMAHGARLDAFAGRQSLDDVAPLRPVGLDLPVRLDHALEEVRQAVAGLAGPEGSKVAVLV